MNSVDASSSDLKDVIEQVGLFVSAGIDFLEISGGTYEDPRMAAQSELATSIPAKESTVQRESFFLSFAQTVRANFPDVVLIVSGGFRTRLGMEAALQSGGCDLIGIARPAAVLPRLPNEIILNEDLKDVDASIKLKLIKSPKWFSLLGWLAPLKLIGAGAQTVYYAEQIQKMGRGLKPVNVRM